MKKRKPIGRRARQTVASTRLADARKRAQKMLDQTKASMQTKPLHYFYGSLIAFVVLIILGNILRKPAPEVVQKAPAPQQVEVYRLGGSAHITVTGEVEKSGVVTIVALTPGIVSSVNVREGATVAKGVPLMRLSSNYYGGNSASVQRQLASVQYQNVLDTYESQKNLIAKQKESAEKMDEQSDEMRNLTNDSLSETKNLIDLNSSIIAKMDANLTLLEADPVTNADLILATKQAKSQFLSVQNQVQSGYRQAKYQASGENTPAELSNLQREIALSQLDMQLKMLDVTKEVSRLQVSLARIMEGTMAPASPFRGVVQRVFVKEGQAVNPGTPLAIVSQAVDDPVTVVVYVSRTIAQKISTTETSTLTIHEKTLELKPYFVSADSVTDGLYAVYFDLPESYVSQVTDRDHVSVQLTLQPSTKEGAVTTSELYIPIDAVHQLSDSAYVFVAHNGTAKTKKVTLGSVFGSRIQVSGLSADDVIILNRDVTSGSRIQITHK